ncbi:3-hydroxyisobutyrate dehydrogenase [Mucidula mucida]|nr:3-hydroxyisobutyrate dehydrogenase [Mucidula mucida]
MRSKSIAFIGLGRMGSEMAYNLFSKTFAREQDARFIVCDAVEDNTYKFCNNFAKQFPGAQISIAQTPLEATLSSRTLITMLPSSPHVKSVYEENVLPALASLSPDIAHETLAIDSTTLDVSVAQQVATKLNGLGVAMVDAPVSGGVTGAKAGTLSFLVGGPEEAYIQSHPILSLMGQRIIHCGPSGAGLGAKICNNLMLGVQQIATAEAMLLGQKLGLDPVVLSSVISSSTGNCWSLSVNNPVPKALPELSPPCERDYNGGFASSLMLKDLRLATDIGNQTSTAMPLGLVAQSIYADMIKDEPDLENKDFSSVYQFLSKK